MGGGSGIYSYSELNINGTDSVIGIDLIIPLELIDFCLHDRSIFLWFVGKCVEALYRNIC